MYHVSKQHNHILKDQRGQSVVNRIWFWNQANMPIVKTTLNEDRKEKFYRKVQKHNKTSLWYLPEAWAPPQRWSLALKVLLLLPHWGCALLVEVVQIGAHSENTTAGVDRVTGPTDLRARGHLRPVITTTHHYRQKNKTAQNIEKTFFNLLRFCLSLSFQHFSMWP